MADGGLGPAAERALLVLAGGNESATGSGRRRTSGDSEGRSAKCIFAGGVAQPDHLGQNALRTLLREKERKTIKKTCQEWDSNPCPFGPVPETGALDQLGHLDLNELRRNFIKILFFSLHSSSLALSSYCKITLMRE
jgi:hypothetical protein